ncbi:MAG: hypothetical protein LQ346_004424 [Caloplaca aetnensis]|nr:MAG: hypothetical protein LQ346_004424 [Caloplaca aetnensis]
MSQKRERHSFLVDESVPRSKISSESDQSPHGKKATDPIPSTVAQRRSLFVHSLPASATTEGLTKLFSESYPLKHATVVSDHQSKQSKGYGFVTFADPSDASAALQAFDGTLFDGKKMKVEFAEPRSRGPNPDCGDVRTTTLLSQTPKELQNAREGQWFSGEPPPRLIVRNLPWSISEPEQLSMLFRSYGKVKTASVPKKGPGLSAGFGFVLLRGRKNALKALTALNGKVVDGRPLAIDWAVQKDVWDSLHQTKVDELGQTNGVLDDGKSTEGVDYSMPPSEIESEVQHEKHRSETTLPNQSSLDGSATLVGPPKRRSEHNRLTTLFVRNVPFTVTDDILSEHFAYFGPIRYARLVMDPSTGRSKGTAFVCFFNEDDAKACLRAAPSAGLTAAPRKRTEEALATRRTKSILEDVDVDSSGRYTLDGRILQVSYAVNKGEATRLSQDFRDRDRDKRRLYLLGEGTISSNTPLYGKLSPSEIILREESARQRQSLTKANPALLVSLTRLSVRNLPRSTNSKELKALAREAVVGFARDVKAGLRQPLSKEELSRAPDVMREAERARKAKGTGIVKQAKVVFEGQGGGKVSESSGAGRSKGYGFIEYTSHRSALMGLRWLNGHAVGRESITTSQPAGDIERKKRLIVEFAIENATVTGRRQERETKSQGRKKTTQSYPAPRPSIEGKGHKAESLRHAGAKRKRSMETISVSRQVGMQDDHEGDTENMQRSAKKQRTIGRKRMARKARKSN